MRTVIHLIKLNHANLPIRCHGGVECRDLRRSMNLRHLAFVGFVRSYPDSTFLPFLLGLHAAQMGLHLGLIAQGSELRLQIFQCARPRPPSQI